jgi:hypothetical protein
MRSSFVLSASPTSIHFGGTDREVGQCRHTNDPLARSPPQSGLSRWPARHMPVVTGRTRPPAGLHAATLCDRFAAIGAGRRRRRAYSRCPPSSRRSVRPPALARAVAIRPTADLGLPLGGVAAPATAFLPRELALPTRSRHRRGGPRKSAAATEWSFIGQRCGRRPTTRSRHTGGATLRRKAFTRCEHPIRRSGRTRSLPSLSQGAE